MADFEGPRWYLLLWLRLTLPISKRLLTPTRGTRELNAAMAARLNPALPDGHSVEPTAAGHLHYRGPNAGGGGTAAASLHLPLPRRWRLLLAVREQLRYYQSAPARHAGTADWPAPGAKAHARVTATEVRLWYADPDGRVVLEFEPIPRGEVGL